MKKLAILCAAAAGTLLLSCTPRSRVVENPLIEAANTSALDVTKIELSDSATVLHVDAYFRPRNWIRIDAKTYLRADGKKYPMTAAEGITPDSLFWMPDSGEASFVLAFEPLPLGTESFDLIESDCDDCFKLYGVDLTGRSEYAEYPRGLPNELRRTPTDGPVPDPVFAVGETTINVHLLGYREETFKQVELHVIPLLGRLETKEAPIDPKNGTARFRFEMHGTSSVSLEADNSKCGMFWAAPGETLNVYVDLRTTGRKIVQRRDGQKKSAHFRTLYTDGRYANLNMLRDMNDIKPILLDCFSPEFADYKMTADAYTQHVVTSYRTLADSLAHSGMSEMMKEQNLMTLRQMTVLAMTSGRYFLEKNYRAVHNLPNRNARIDYRFATLERKHYAAICELFDLNDPTLLMGDHAYNFRMIVSRGIVDWGEIAGIDEGPVADFRKTADLVGKAEEAALSDEEFALLRSLKNPFYAEACEAIQARVREALEAVEGKVRIEPTPEVGLDRLFDAIIAPYKGKVVFVDFWNTWCSPCQASIKATEPLKSGTLKSDDLVWIYIANETSPMVAYKTQIPAIAGKHYRLDKEQWSYLCKKFGIDGIPSYVLVGKDGSYRLRNDLREHHKLEETLKAMIE